MRFFSVAGGVRGVPVALQMVPAGNVVPELLEVEDVLLVEVVEVEEVELEVLVDELVVVPDEVLVDELVVVPDEVLVDELVVVPDEVLVDEVDEPPLPLELALVVVPDEVLVDALVVAPDEVVVDEVDEPPPPLELEPPLLQAARDWATSGMATRQVLRAREGSFTGPLSGAGRRRAHGRARWESRATERRRGEKLASSPRTFSRWPGRTTGAAGRAAPAGLHRPTPRARPDAGAAPARPVPR